MVTVVVGDTKCYSIGTMARILRRSTSSLRYLCLHDTRVHRPLKHFIEGRHIYIPISEIEEFPWHDGRTPYKYVLDKPKDGEDPTCIYYKRNYDI